MANIVICLLFWMAGLSSGWMLARLRYRPRWLDMLRFNAKLLDRLEHKDSVLEHKDGVILACHSCIHATLLYLTVCGRRADTPAERSATLRMIYTYREAASRLSKEQVIS